MQKPIPSDDLATILSHLKEDLPLLAGERILLTGATGFFGKWLTQVLLAADQMMGLNLRLVILTRSRERALIDSPWLKGRVEWAEGDIRETTPQGPFTSIIHGAAAASRDLNENRPTEMFDTIVDGTRNVLELAQTPSCRRFLFLSSGAVYGTQADEHVAETARSALDPLDARAAYGEAKRAAEFLCASHSRTKGFDLKIARCFAFVGPYLPLDTHFAAGNFLGCALKNEMIKIAGDGTPVRSYLYAADLITWLLRILVRGENLRAYNVGSENAVTIAELAEITHRAALKLNPERALLKTPIAIGKAPLPGQKAERYVPSTKRARSELQLKEWTDANSAFSKTLAWHLFDR